MEIKQIGRQNVLTCVRRSWIEVDTIDCSDDVDPNRMGQRGRRGVRAKANGGVPTSFAQVEDDLDEREDNFDVVGDDVDYFEDNLDVVEDNLDLIEDIFDLFEDKLDLIEVIFGVFEDHVDVAGNAIRLKS